MTDASAKPLVVREWTGYANEIHRLADGSSYVDLGAWSAEHNAVVAELRSRPTRKAYERQVISLTEEESRRCDLEAKLAASEAALELACKQRDNLAKCLSFSEAERERLRGALVAARPFVCLDSSKTVGEAFDTLDLIDVALAPAAGPEDKE